jgi:hypothetical protein
MCACGKDSLINSNKVPNFLLAAWIEIGFLVIE